MKLLRRIKVASDIVLGKSIDSERIVSEVFDVNPNTVGIFGGLGIDDQEKERFEPVSVKELEEMTLERLIPKVIRSDPAIDQVVSFFTTLVTQDHKITAESSRGERAIEEIIMMLEEKKNPIELAIAHCASSLIMRGDICVETEFNENGKPENLWVPDPKWVEWRLIRQDGVERWALGNYRGGSWKEIESPNVWYRAGDPLIGDRSSRSPLQTALFPALSQTSMIRSLQSVIDIHAWAQTVFVVKKLEMIKLQSDGGDIEDVNAQVNEAMGLIEKVLAKKKQDQIMGVTDDIEPMQLSGGGANLTFTRDIGSLYDKRVAQGAKTPTTVGGPAERADYSTRQNGLFYSLYLQSSQQNIGSAMKWSFKRFLRSMGITDDPIYTSKSVNVEARMIEAKAFQEIMTGIKQAVDAGMPLPRAIEFFEEEAGQSFSADLKSKIEKEYVAPKPESPQDKIESILNSENNYRPTNQDNNHLATAIVEYLHKKDQKETGRR